jgi:uncharacterized tellurite resistance protein B-like protein
MLDRLNRLLRAFAPGSPAKPMVVFDEDDHRVAAAGLLVHAMNADGVRSPSELARLEALLAERFSLDGEQVQALIKTADRRNREAIDFNAFTGIVKRAYDREGRDRIVEMMWEIVFADGTLHEFEDNMVWRVAEIIGVPPEQRMLIRRNVAEARGIEIAEASE